MTREKREKERGWEVEEKEVGVEFLERSKKSCKNRLREDSNMQEQRTAKEREIRMRKESSPDPDEARLHKQMHKLAGRVLRRFKLFFCCCCSFCFILSGLFSSKLETRWSPAGDGREGDSPARPHVTCDCFKLCLRGNEPCISNSGGNCEVR
ncbi:hypothetical protein HDV57DRAFT_31307 [Trichoderma longibrachiatum]